MTDKRAIRAAARQARASFKAEAGIELPSAFATRLTPDLVVAAYVPIGAEADPVRLVEAARDAGCRLALPVTADRTTPIMFVAWDDDMALADGPFGLRQPTEVREALAPEIILAPLVAFDRRGHRIGQGAGHYDRAFAAYPDAWRIGIAWSVQEVAACPADPWDVPLHAIATEKEWITP